MITFQRSVANLFAWRTITRMTKMFYSLLVMAIRVVCADLLTARRFGIFFLPAGNRNLCFSAVALNLVSLGTGITGPLVTSRQAFMILTIQCFPAHLLTGRTVSVAAFLVAWMLPTVSDAFTFNITGKLSGTLDLFTLSSASAGLVDHLETGRTVTPVASKHTIFLHKKV